ARSDSSVRPVNGHRCDRLGRARRRLADTHLAEHAGLFLAFAMLLVHRPEAVHLPFPVGMDVFDGEAPEIFITGRTVTAHAQARRSADLEAIAFGTRVFTHF